MKMTRLLARWKRVALMMCFEAAAVLAWSCASAQMVGTSMLPAPRERVTLDQNHVDAISGAVVFSFPLLSIGPGQNGLQLVAYYNSQGSWRDSFSGMLDLTLADTQQSVSASWGNQGWSFAGQAGDSTSGDGASLTPDGFGNFLLTTRDGTVITYSLLTTPQNASCPSDLVCHIYYFPVQIVHPNGLTLTQSYRVYVAPSSLWWARLQSVTTNTGYQIKFTYQSNDTSAPSAWEAQTGAMAINNAVDYCDPAADTCSLSANWPAVSYASGSNTFTMTDALNRVTRFTYATTSLKVKTAASAADNFQYVLQSYLDGEGMFLWRATSATVGSNTWAYQYVQSPSAGPFYTLTTTSSDPFSHSSVYVSGRRDLILGQTGVHPTWALNSVKNALNRTTTFSYPCSDGGTYFNGEAYNISLPETNGTTRTCDSRGNVTTTTVVSKTGGVCGNGKICTSQTFPSTCSNPKTCNQPIATIDGRGAQTDYEYSPTHGGVTKETLPAVDICAMPAGTPCASVRPQKRYEYQQFYAYVKNSSGALVTAAAQVWLPTRVSECRTSAYAPPPALVPCAAGAADEVVTSYEYGATGTVNRLLVRGKVVTSNGVSLRTCYSYDAIGNRVSETTPRAGLSACPELPAGGAAFTTWFRYDAGRQLVGAISAPVVGGYEAVRNKYDDEGRLLRSERGALAQWQPATILPANWPGFTAMDVRENEYDSVGRMVTAKHSSGTGADLVLTQYSYDAAGRLECTAIRMNPAAYGSLPWACLKSAVGPDGPDRITRRIYDFAGQMITEQRGVDTTLVQNFATYDYTPNGRRDWVRDANNNLTDFAYDGFDRLKRLTFPSVAVGAPAGNPNDYEEYGYDDNNNRTSLRLRSSELISYQYDALNRLKYKDLPSGNDIAYRYDLQGHNTLARFGSTTGLGVTNDFDGFGRQSSSTSVSSSGSLQLGYLYDDDGNRTRVTWPDGNFVQYTYDGLDRMDQVRENGASSGPGLLADYSYDLLSRRSNLYRGNGTTTTFYPDGISRLDHLTHDFASTPDDVTFGFIYNKASQVTQRSVSNDSYSYFSLPESRSYTPNGLNQYSNVAGSTYNYDSRGNLISDGSRGFTYDYENHLLTVSGGAGSSLEYDPMGRLLTSTSGGVTTRYLYAGDELVAEYVGSALKRRYVHGAQLDEPLVWYEGAGFSDRRWLHTDHRGSIVATSDGSGQATVYAYGAYGEPAYDNWGGSRFRYTGQIALPEAKLYHYKARVYDPRIGRFLQTDPVGYQDDLNLYAYVGNDPLDRADPTGLCAEDACVVEGGVAALGAVAYYGSAALVATGACMAACDKIQALHDWIGDKASAIWNHIVHNQSDPQPKTDQGRKAPPGNGGTTDHKHGSDKHDELVNGEVDKMRDKGYGDIRKDQAQVDANGNKVGDNRPDVQGTNPETGQREYVEVDRNAGRSIDHYQEIMKNDPSGKCTLVPCP